MEKTIKREDFVNYAYEVWNSEILKDLYEKDPALILLIILISKEFENVIFKEETGDDE